MNWRVELTSFLDKISIFYRVKNQNFLNFLKIKILMLYKIHKYNVLLIIQYINF